MKRPSDAEPMPAVVMPESADGSPLALQLAPYVRVTARPPYDLQLSAEDIRLADRNPDARELILVRLYTLATFNQLDKPLRPSALTTFQARNKYLFMALDPARQKALGRLAASAHSSDEDTEEAYREALDAMLASPLSRGRYVNALQHMWGYVADDRTAEDKETLFAHLTAYQSGKMSLYAPLALLQTWALECEQAYLLDQTIFSPYPPSLRPDRTP